MKKLLLIASFCIATTLSTGCSIFKHAERAKNESSALTSTDSSGTASKDATRISSSSSQEEIALEIHFERPAHARRDPADTCLEIPGGTVEPGAINLQDLTRILSGSPDLLDHSRIPAGSLPPLKSLKLTIKKSAQAADSSHTAERDSSKLRNVRIDTDKASSSSSRSFNPWLFTIPFWIAVAWVLFLAGRYVWKKYAPFLIKHF